MKFVLFVFLSVFSFSMPASAQIVGGTTLTVSAPTDTSLVLACPSGINVGPNAGTCSATGNLSGSPYTAVWTSNDTSHVTINSGSGVLAGVANGTCASFCIHAVSGSLTGNFGAITVTTQGSGSGNLLGGYTVNASNQPSGPIPPGWTLVMADGAETGVAQGGEDLSHVSQCTQGNVTPLGTTVPAHTLTHSYCGEYAGDQQNVSVQINIPNGISQLYFSWFERLDPQGMYPSSDYIPAQVYQNGNNGPVIGFQAQTFSGNGSFLSTNMYPHTYQANTNEFFGYSGPVPNLNPTINASVWVQFEMLIIPDTVDGTQLAVNEVPPNPCTSTSQHGCGNGTLKLWQNGNLVADVENAQLTFNSNFFTNAVLHIGDFLTSFANSSIQANGRCDAPWSSTGGGNCPGTQPGSGAPKPFFRYFDDLIVMRQ